MKGIKAIHRPGERYGRLTLVNEDPVRHGPHRKIRWVCRCECGSIGVFTRENLVNGKTRSCGCLFREVAGHRTHGRSHTPEHDIWTKLRTRCANPNNPDYARYGGRGIRVCAEWDNFERFLADMGFRPSPRHSIGRIDNDGPYSRSNCRWETSTQQANNRRSGRWITHNGETHTVAEWARSTGINATTIRRRLDDYGWPVEIALSHVPVHPQKG